MSRRVTFWRIMGLAFGCSIVGFGAIVGTRRPSNQRHWALDHARAPAIAFADSLVRIADLRALRYRTAEDVEPRYEARTYNMNRLTSVWFVLAPFSKAWRGAAHGFVSFGFGDSRFVSISIEARREVGEEYGLLRGLGRNFELIYVIGDERDVIGKRAAFGDFDVFLYPIRTTPERAQALFVDMLRRADRLQCREDRPGRIPAPHRDGGAGQHPRRARVGPVERVNRAGARSRRRDGGMVGNAESARGDALVQCTIEASRGCGCESVLPRPCVALIRKLDRHRGRRRGS